MKEYFLFHKAESYLSPVQKAYCPKMSIYLTLFFLVLFILGCKGNNKLDDAIKDVRENCIESLSSAPNDKYSINNAEYGLSNEWHYEFNKEKISVL